MRAEEAEIVKLTKIKEAEPKLQNREQRMADDADQGASVLGSRACDLVFFEFSSLNETAMTWRFIMT